MVANTRHDKQMYCASGKFAFNSQHKLSPITGAVNTSLNKLNKMDIELNRCIIFIQRREYS